MNIAVIDKCLFCSSKLNFDAYQLAKCCPTNKNDAEIASQFKYWRIGHSFYYGVQISLETIVVYNNFSKLTTAFYTRSENGRHEEVLKISLVDFDYSSLKKFKKQVETILAFA